MSTLPRLKLGVPRKTIIQDESFKDKNARSGIEAKVSIYYANKQSFRLRENYFVIKLLKERNNLFKTNSNNVYWFYVYQDAFKEIEKRNNFVSK